MKRLSAVLDGMAHGAQPIPNVCRVGALVTTGNVSGQSPGGELPGSLAAQCRLMFENLAVMLAQVGAGLEDVVHVNVSLADKASREALNDAWREVFPDGRSCPTRITRVQELGRGLLVQCDAIACCAR